MALFYTEYIALDYANIEAAKRWWVQVFDCKTARVRPDWDGLLPSDITLKLPGDEQPAILLRDRTESAPTEEHPILFCTQIEKAHEYLRSRGPAPSPIQELGGARFFQIRDRKGHVIEICEEP